MTSIEMVRVARRTLDVHRPDKVLFPASGSGKEYKKSDLVACLRRVVGRLAASTSGVS
ncbi:hypothetical protein ACFVZD_39445 [Streptomyces sp. NPDC058287]|uniref:hypothetical protein n=1 Tax=unclassified Streptomyces TaxID=2593676 RepID=UPI0036E56A7C